MLIQGPSHLHFLLAELGEIKMKESEVKEMEGNVAGSNRGEIVISSFGRLLIINLI